MSIQLRNSGADLIVTMCQTKATNAWLMQIAAVKEPCRPHFDRHNFLNTSGIIVFTHKTVAQKLILYTPSSDRESGSGPQRERKLYQQP
jgi:hypothetical protein